MLFLVRVRDWMLKTSGSLLTSGFSSQARKELYSKAVKSVFYIFFKYYRNSTKLSLKIKKTRACLRIWKKIINFAADFRLGVEGAL